MFVSKSTLIALIPFLLPATVYAKNDWSVPCTKGVCSWDTGDGVKEAWSTLAINGGVNSISDITNAAGWEILGCDGKTTKPQDIRLVCTNPSKGCDSLFKGGADNTIVRLPNWCGPGPFARVSKAWVHQDQSLPPKVAKKMKRGVPDPKQPVRGLTFDFDFSKVPASKGTVNFIISSTSNPRQRGLLDKVEKRDLVSVRHGNADLQTRGLFDKFIDKAKNLKDKVVGGAGKVIDKVGQAADKVGDIAKDVNGFDQNFNKDLPPIDFSKEIVFVDASLDCPATAGRKIGFGGGAKVSADVKLTARASAGMIVKGTIVPAKLNDLALTGSASAQATAKFTIQANAKGSFDSQKIPFFAIGIPGLSIPGIIDLGPKVTVNTRIKASLDGVADATLTTGFNVENLSLVFPPEKGKSSATVMPQDTPINIGKVGAEGDIKSTAELHLIPSLEFGVNVLNGLGKAVVSLDVDGLARLDMNLLAGTSGSDNGKQLGGCFGVGLGIDIGAGATAAIPPFFNKNTKASIFNKDKEVFAKCFGDQAGQETDFKSTRTAKPKPKRSWDSVTPILVDRDLESRQFLDNIKPFVPQLACPGIAKLAEPKVSENIKSSEF